MWAPGTLLYLRGNRRDLLFSGGVSWNNYRPAICFVVSHEKLKFGTQGWSYNVWFLIEGRFIKKVIDSKAIKCFDVVLNSD